LGNWNTYNCPGNDAKFTSANEHRKIGRERPMKAKRVLGFFAAAILLMSSVPAFARAPAPGAGGGAAAKPAAAGGKDEGYGYEFSDDPLAAGGFGPNDATIRVRPGPVRTTLIRPRTSFVPEMLKSVENL
jgi:hypothetical protein